MKRCLSRSPPSHLPFPTFSAAFFCSSGPALSHFPTLTRLRSHSLQQYYFVVLPNRTTAPYQSIEARPANLTPQVQASHTRQNCPSPPVSGCQHIAPLPRSKNLQTLQLHISPWESPPAPLPSAIHYLHHGPSPASIFGDGTDAARRCGSHEAPVLSQAAGAGHERADDQLRPLRRRS
jgi:hypothetical protein